MNKEPGAWDKEMRKDFNFKTGGIFPHSLEHESDIFPQMPHEVPRPDSLKDLKKVLEKLDNIEAKLNNLTGGYYFKDGIWRK